MTQQTALDELVCRLLLHYQQYGDLDFAAETIKQDWQNLCVQALQDPRYLAYCKEQDEKEWQDLEDILTEAVCGELVDKPFKAMFPEEQDRKEEEPSGFSWRLSDECLAEIEAIEANSRRAAFNAQFIMLD